MRVFVVGLAIAVSLFAGREAVGAPVRGLVLRSPAPPPRTTTVNRYRDRAPVSSEASDPANCGCNPGVFAVVHLTGENLPKPTMPMAPPVVAQKDRMFVPSVIAIPVGASVDFPNWDPYFHNVFSYSKVRKFDLGRYPQGNSESVRFEEPGIVPVFCEIHYSMRAYIHVVDSPYYAVSDELRQFEIPDVAPGDYTLHVWQENLPEITRPLVVRDDPVYVEIP